MPLHAENFQVYPEALGPGTEVGTWRVVEWLGALATREEAQGSFTLKLWEAGMGRTVSLSGISFP